jgi:hypothetical protein
MAMRCPWFPWCASAPWCANPLVCRSTPSGDRGKNKPLVRKAGARQRLVLGERQVTFTWMLWYPVAPLGSVRCFTAVWV